MRNKIKFSKIYLLILFIAMLSMVSATTTLGTFGQNKCVILKQTCANCTFVNITSVTAKTNEGQSVQLMGDVAMTKTGSEYNYTFCKTGYIGEYTYNTLGNPDGVLTVEPVTFNIGQNSIILYVIIFIIIYAVSFIGFFGRNIWVSLIGGFGMMALGIFVMNAGIDGFRMFITNVISIITIGIGAIFALTAGLELIKDTYGG